MPPEKKQALVDEMKREIEMKVKKKAEEAAARGKINEIKPIGEKEKLTDILA